jgi:hypothetical protein
MDFGQLFSKGADHCLTLRILFGWLRFSVPEADGEPLGGDQANIEILIGLDGHAG